MRAPVTRLASLPSLVCKSGNRWISGFQLRIIELGLSYFNKIVKNLEMWNDTMTGEGGYYENAETPQTDKREGVTKRAEAITPVVIGMLKKCKHEEFKIWGMPAQMIKVVAIMRRFEVTSTKITYEVEDHTGRITAILWLEQDASKQQSVPVDKENSYVRIFGTLRTEGQGKIIMILRIQPIDFMNEITTHLLEVIHTRYMLEKLSRGESLAIKQNNPGAELSNSMLTFTNTNSTAANCSEEANMTQLQVKLYRFIKSSSSKIGVQRNSIHDQFPHISHRDIAEALEFLSSEGHVFSTIDNDHFKHTY